MENRVMSTLRSMILVIFLIGVVGTAVELLLLEHTGEILQWIPLALLLLSLAVLCWHGLERRGSALRVFRGVMVLFILGGLTGVYLHYRSNVEFELEMYPTMGGLELFGNAMMGAMPALAPGVMIQFGLLGLAYVYKHPALSRMSR